MGYTNSSLVSYTKLSPNHSGQRTHSIDRITPHCVVGQLSAASICGCFTSPDRQASCNYGIGTDGQVSLCVEEKNRSWCTSSNANDQRAITIECASDKTDPYAMNSKVYSSLINLCVDICRRNGKKKLLWFADKNKTLAYEPKSDEMVLTVHRWFANKSCPGDWLYSRLGDLANKVTSALGGTAETPSQTTSNEVLYNVRKSWADAKSQLGAYKVLTNAKKMADKNPGYYVFDEKGNAIYPEKTSAPATKKVAYAQSKDKALAGSYRVTANSGLNLRYEPGKLDDEYIILTIPVNAVVHNYGYYTTVNGVKWLYVEYRGQVGFVHSSYLRKV